MSTHDNWDDHWDRYAAAAGRNPAQQMRHAIVEKLLLREIDGSAVRILNIGSGQGDLLARLHRALPQARLLGLEQSANGIAFSRPKVPDAVFVEADLFHPPDELKQYAGWATHAICSEVLEHVDDPVAFLCQCRAYMGGGAQLVVTVPGGPMSAFDRSIGHRRHFTKKSTAQVLEAAGFAVERMYRSGFPFFNLYRCIIIARGERLAVDVRAGQSGFSALLAGGGMAIFRGLFRFNAKDSPWGWQIVAVARKTAAS